MLASRSVRPKLSLNISNAAAASSARPVLSLKSPIVATQAMPRTPVSPSPVSPTVRNTRLNQRGFSTVQHPSFAYANHSSQPSILKKGSSPSSAASRRLHFREEPTVHAITPIENGEEYYGAYSKMTREERRWSRR